MQCVFPTFGLASSAFPLPAFIPPNVSTAGFMLLCQKLMAAMRDVSHPISFLAPQETIRTIPYQLRSGNTIPTRTMKKTKRANDFFTFRFG